MGILDLLCMVPRLCGIYLLTSSIVHPFSFALFCFQFTSLLLVQVCTVVISIGFGLLRLFSQANDCWHVCTCLTTGTGEGGYPIDMTSSKIARHPQGICKCMNYHCIPRLACSWPLGLSTLRDQGNNSHSSLVD